jgi:hypothetical protein
MLIGIIGGPAMRVLTKLLVTALLQVCAASLFSQTKHDANPDETFARLSYNESGSFKCCLKEPPADGKPKVFIPAIDPADICIAVSVTGNYRVTMILDGRPQHLQGTMPDDKLRQLKTLLSSHDFRGLSGDHGGLLRQNAETFAAEVVMQSDATGVLRTQRLQWLNPDDNNPFPQSVSKIISWLKDFEPKGGKEFVYSEFSDVCPSRGFRLLHPAVAATQTP